MAKAKLMGWQLVRDDGIVLMDAFRKKDLVAALDNPEIRELTANGRWPAHIEKVPSPYCPFGGCDGHNEDWAVYYQQCDICWKPIK